MDNFNQVFTLTETNNFLLKLFELHDGTNNVHEQKYCSAQQSYDTSQMK
jgi:hypothetical protein